MSTLILLLFLSQDIKGKVVTTGEVTIPRSAIVDVVKRVVADVMPTPTPAPTVPTGTVLLVPDAEVSFINADGCKVQVLSMRVANPEQLPVVRVITCVDVPFALTPERR